MAKALGYLDAENVVVDEQFVESRPLVRDIVARGRADITKLRANQYIHDEPLASTVALILKLNPQIVSMPAKEAIADSIEFNRRVTPKNGKLTDAEVQAVIAFTLAQGQIKQPVALEKVTDYSFVEEAARQLEARK